MQKFLVSACIVIAILAFRNEASAQAQFSLGVKAGPNFASMDGTRDGEPFKNKTGYHFGAFALIKLTKIGIQPEVLFSQQGGKVRVNTEEFDANFSYINIPVIFKLYTIAGINIQAGPQFGFLSKAELESVKDTDDLKESDFSVALGAGWDLPFGLTIDARYNLGLTKVGDSDIYKDVKNQVWQISVGYKLIKIGK